MRPRTLALLWIICAIADLIVKLATGGEVGIFYWFALGAAIFFIGVDRITQAIKDREDVS